MRRFFLALVCVAAVWSARGQGMPVVSIPRIDVMPDYPGPPAIAQISQDRAVVVWCAAEEQKIAIYASGVIARLGSVDDHPVRVAEVSGLTMVQPLVAAMGGGYVVVWPEPDGAHAVVMRSSTSKYIPPQPIIANAVPLAIATSSDETLLAFAVQSPTPRNEWRVGIAFLTDTAGIAKLEWIDTLAAAPNAALTVAGDGFLLAYSERRSSSTILVRRVTSASVSSATTIGDAAYSESVAIAASSGGALAIWSTFGSGTNLVARHLDLSGHPNGDTFSMNYGGSDPDVAWNGSAYLVTYTVGLGIDIGFVGETSTVLDGVQEVGRGSSSRVASDGSTSTLAWFHPSSGTAAGSPSTIEAAGIDSEERVISKVTVSHNFTRQDHPVAATAGEVTLVAWTEQTGRDARSVFAARVDREGRPLDPNGISLCDGKIQGAPAVASNRSEFLVVWPEVDASSRTSRIIGQRIPSAGSPDLLGGPFEITGAPQTTIFDLAVVWNGEHYLVAWPMSHSAAPHRGMNTALVLPTGVVRTRGTIDLAQGFDPVMSVALAVMPEGFLVAAQIPYGNGIPGGSGIFTDILPLDNSGQAVGPGRVVNQDGSGAALAAIGDRALAVWSELGKGLYGQYFDGAANYASSPFLIDDDPVTRHASVVSDGTGFVVAFDTGESAHLPLLATIRGSYVTGMSIAAEPSVRNDPAAALVATDSGLLSVFRAFDETWTNVARVYTRSVPGTGAVDLAADLSAPSEAQPGSIVRVQLRVANVGTQLATGIESLVRALGHRIVNFPDGCQADPFFVEVLCPVQELQPGSTAYLYFDVEIDADASPIEAKAYAHEQDPATANNVASTTVRMSGTSRLRPARR